MRVALVCGEYRPDRDGVAHYTARLGTELAARGASVVVATADPRGGGDAPSGAAPPGAALPVRSVTGGWSLLGVVRAARALRRLRPDVVHVQFAPSAYAWHGEIGLLPWFLGGTPLVTTVHEYHWWTWAPPRLAPLLARRFWPFLERRGLWDRETGLLTVRAATVVATNAGHAAAARRRLPATRVVEVPIGPNVVAAQVDRTDARASLTARYGIAPGAPVVAFFGFVHAVKGIRYLLDAAARLRTQRPDLAVLLIGGVESLALRGREADDYRDEVRTMIAGYGLDGAVHLTGWLPDEDVSRCLAAADVAALPFTAGTTTKSGSLLTCAQHGLPLVATAADPPDPELVDGETALLVPPRDGMALAAALDRVLGDRALTAALAAAARRLAARHGWEAIAVAHLQRYAEATAP